MAKLQPTQVTANTMGDHLFNGVRRRPVLAEMPNGQLVVCCRRTAKAKGWAVQGTAFARTRSAAPAAP